MIENKRFTLTNRSLSEIGNDIAIADNGVPCTQRFVCNLLNELIDENEQLESELKKVVETCRKYGIYKEELKHVLADYDKMLNENGERAIRYKYCANSR